MSVSSVSLLFFWPSIVDYSKAKGSFALLRDAGLVSVARLTRD